MKQLENETSKGDQKIKELSVQSANLYKSILCKTDGAKILYYFPLESNQNNTEMTYVHILHTSYIP